MLSIFSLVPGAFKVGGELHMIVYNRKRNKAIVAPAIRRMGFGIAIL